MQRQSIRKGVFVPALAGLIALLLVGGGSAIARSGGPKSAGTNAKSAGAGTITVGVLAGFTGKFSGFGTFIQQGVLAAVDEINKSGGVLGRKLAVATGDTQSDAIDAVPGLQQLLVHSPNFLVGPTSAEFAAVKNLVDSTNIPDMAYIGSTDFDNLRDKWVYNISPPDAGQAKALAYYALHNGWKSCALVFDNTTVSQSVAPPLLAAYTKHGGHVAANITITPDASSYRSEVLQMAAAKPKCVFMQLSDAQTVGTFFSDLRQLGALNIPFLGTDPFAQSQYLQAAGPDGDKLLTVAIGAQPAGAAWKHFVQTYTKENGQAPNSASANFYDAVVIDALAMTAAKSVNGPTWLPKILKVVNGPGTPVTTWAQGKRLLAQGKKISYVGASGISHFDPVHHSITSGFSMEQTAPGSTTTLTTKATVTAKDLQNF